MTTSGLLSDGNHLFELARRGRLRLPGFLGKRGKRVVDGVVYPLAVFLFTLAAPLLAGILAFPCLALLFFGGGTDPTADAGQTTGLLLIFSFAPMFLLVWGWLALFEQRSLSSVGLERPGLGAKYLRGLAIGLMLFVAVVSLLALTGSLAINGGDRSGPAVVAIVIFFVGWLVQGAAEEVLTRGFFLPIFGIRYGALPAVVLSSVTFAALHLLNANVSPLAILNLSLFGLFAALYALAEGGLWGIGAVHGIWNWAEGNLFGFQVSGGVVSAPAIVNLAEAGPDWLTGGDFGPEGGLAVTLVLILASVLVWLIHRRRARTPASSE